MKIYDITQEVFGCQVYPGDPEPKRQVIQDMKRGDLYNLTSFSMCAHNGTHVDAPLHFFANGNSVDQIDLQKFVGMAYVAKQEGVLEAAHARELVRRTKELCKDGGIRILMKGDAVVSWEAAQVFAQAKIDLYGTELQSVGAEHETMKVHLTMLGAQIVLLEGIRLEGVAEGMYLLCAAPLNLGGAEGAPCRAVLIEN